MNRISQLEQRGIAALTGIMVIVVVAAIAGVGWYVYSNNALNSTEQGAAIEQPPVSKEEAPEVKESSDLDDAANALDKQDIDTKLDTTELEADINSLF
jgi:uncharacterized protein HemX